MFIIDMNSEKIWIGKFRMAKGTFRVDLFEWRWIGFGIRCIIEMLMKMNNQLNIILQNDIVTDRTLKSKE